MWFGHVVAAMQSAFFRGDEPPSRNCPSRPRGARANQALWWCRATRGCCFVTRGSPVSEPLLRTAGTDVTTSDTGTRYANSEW